MTEPPPPAYGGFSRARCDGLHHVNLRVPVEEIPALTTFYIEVVGLTVGPRPPFDSPGVWRETMPELIFPLDESAT